MGRTLEVLVADDDPSILLLLRTLEELEDLRITTAVDGLDALAKAREGTFDLFVFDLMMPAMNGLELTRVVREDPELTAVPVIIVTARATDDARDDAMDAGADRFMTKPVGMNDLARAITDLTNSRRRRRRRRG